jgi:NADH-quinone oxidoreductase subunit M
MTWFESNILTILMLLPLAGAVAVAALPGEEKQAVRHTALFFSLVNFIISTWILFGFDGKTAAMQYETKAEWVPALGITYHVGIDGISLFLVLLTTFLVPLVILSAYKAHETHVREYMISMLVLETAMLGALVSLDMVLFYVFWELMLIPMYILIGVFGGQRRIYAAVKFFIYTMVGSLLMLVAFLYIYFRYGQQTGDYTFDLLKLYGTKLSWTEQFWCFLAFALAFAIKVPMFPVHTWLPDAHVEAPTGGSVILAGVLLKMGTYGFLRFALPLFPYAAKQLLLPLAILSVIGIVYGALVAMVQPDIKKLVAYSSVSHLGFVMLGITAWNETGVSGAILQMLNHGVSTGALFLLVGVIYERTHTRQIEDYGGIAKVVPIYSLLFLIVTMSSIGLPPLNGFIGEFMIMIGAFTSTAFDVNGVSWAQGITAVAATGVILAAVYMLWMVQRVFFGPLKDTEAVHHLTEINAREMVVLAPLILLIFVMGLFPNLFLDKMQASVSALITDFNTRSKSAEVVVAPQPGVPTFAANGQRINP